MSWRVIKGWAPKTISAEDLLWWEPPVGGDKIAGFNDTLTEDGVIVRFKGKKSAWKDWAWPLNRVTIVIEVED